jgi:hypothetical protein
MERLTTLFNDVRLSDRVRGLARWQNPVAASPAAPLETVAALFTLEPVTDVDTSAADVIQSRTTTWTPPGSSCTSPR